MRTHDRPVETIPTSHTQNLTITTCEQAIDLLVQQVVGCHCTCPQDLLEIARWKDRRLDLIARRLPTQREGD